MAVFTVSQTVGFCFKCTLTEHFQWELAYIFVKCAVTIVM